MEVEYNSHVWAVALIFISRLLDRVQERTSTVIVPVPLEPHLSMKSCMVHSSRLFGISLYSNYLTRLFFRQLIYANVFQI